MKNLHPIASGVNVRPLVDAIHRNPSVWNRHPQRTESPNSPHYEMDDIWLRYNDITVVDVNSKEFHEQHDAVWYPAANLLPQAFPIIFDLMRKVEGEHLGGVLVTRIHPGKQCRPHIDEGWHAQYYDKYAVQLESAPGQTFHVEDEVLYATPGDVYMFDNSKLHWVLNNSNHDRMTMIVCIRSRRQ